MTKCQCKIDSTGKSWESMGFNLIGSKLQVLADSQHGEYCISCGNFEKD